MISIFGGLNKIIINNDLFIYEDFDIIKNPLVIDEIRDESTNIAVGSIDHGLLIKNPVLLQRLMSEEETSPYKLIKNFRSFFQFFFFQSGL